jgi:hypothetical protein
MRFRPGCGIGSPLPTSAVSCGIWIVRGRVWISAGTTHELLRLLVQKTRNDFARVQNINVHDEGVLAKRALFDLLQGGRAILAAYPVFARRLPRKLLLASERKPNGSSPTASPVWGSKPPSCAMRCWKALRPAKRECIRRPSID